MAAKDGNWAGFTANIAGGAGASLNMGSVQKAIGMGSETAKFVSQGIQAGSGIAQGFMSTGNVSGDTSTSSSTTNKDASNVDVNANDSKPTKSLDEIFSKYKKG